MKKQNIILGLILIGLSVILHSIHFVIFRDLHHMMIFLFADVAFIPLEVLFVTLILERLIKKQEEEKILKKMHMLVGLFYQKFGDSLLKTFVQASADLECDRSVVLMDYKWTKKEYQNLKQVIKNHKHHLAVEKMDLNDLFDFLKRNEALMINLISNPSLQENDVFSDLLMATFHLYDELGSREINNIIGDDLVHIKYDCERIYKLLSYQWVNYMEHLQTTYPYLFLTAATNNPYDQRELNDITTALMASRPLL